MGEKHGGYRETTRRAPVEEKVLRLDLLPILLQALLSPNSRARKRNLRRQCEFVQRLDLRAHFKHGRHRADHVADRVRLLADEDARVLVHLGDVHWPGHVVHDVLPSVPHLARLPKGDFDALAGRDHRRHDRFGFGALGRHALRLPLEIQVLVVGNDAEAPAEEGVEDVARESQPL
jgi:hypothetical protein